MKLWSGRFEKETDKIVDLFNASINVDKRMYRQDIEGSIAHVRMLGSCGIIGPQDAELIENGLMAVLSDIENGKAEFSEEAEDIHMNIETLLIQKIGETGKKLHTARSRNDQVALDFRMYVKLRITEIIELVKALEHVILDKAEENLETLMPGYTHLQKAQPITLGHHLMAYFEMFRRDMGRLADCKKRTDVMPLGSCALAGTTYPINREFVADQLGFSAVSSNSMDSVSDRDFAIEFVSCCSMLMMHMSRFCEELIIWNTNEFGFVEMDDAYSTGSSIMPQKKNPDVAELVRGKTGRVYGSLITLLTLMKALPLAYNKDMQEDKEAAFDAADTVQNSLEVFTPMLHTVKFNKDNMAEKLKGGFMNATDLADYLVKKGIPFRTAHEITGNMVKYCITNAKAIEDMTLSEMKSFSDRFEEDVYLAVSYEECVSKRNTSGGPAPSQVALAVKAGRDYLDQPIV